MPLALVTGPANAAKAGEVLGGYVAAAHRGGLLVVPTAADAEHYGREVAAQGAVLGSVLTFSGLMGEIAARAGYRARRISPLARERLLRRVAHDTQLGLLRQSADSPGFSLAAGALISELQRSLITPARLTQALRVWAGEDEGRVAYGAEVASIYSAYARALERLGRVDADGFAWGALDALRSDPGRWGDAPVFLYGFDDLDTLERDAVETLARIAGAQLTVSLTYEPGRVAFDARAEAVQELLPLADRVVELPGLDEHYAPESREVLHHLERCLFESGAGGVDAGRAVRLLEAGGERAEAELVAAEVLEMLGAGILAQEIVVLCRSMRGHGRVLERVLEEYGVSAAVDRRVPARETALGRGLLGLCRCAWLPGAETGELLAYLRSPGRLERPELADRVEAQARCAGIHDAEGALALVGWEVGEIEALRGARDRLGELERQARRLQEAPRRGQAPLLGPEERRDAAALAAVLGGIEELRELGEDPSGLELLKWLEQLTLRQASSHPPDAVLVTEPLGVRARRFRAVIVCGLQEGEFPAPSSPEPFLSDELRRELAMTSGLRLRPREDALARERYLFYACVSRATEQLVLSYRSSDEEGNVELRSPFLSDVEDLLTPGWSDRRRRRLLADVVWDPAHAPTALERARAQAAVASEGVAAASDAAGGAGERRLGATALSFARHSEVVSPGALESYAQCPVKWLVEKQLDPKRFEPEPDPLVRGSYVHKLLEGLLERLGQPVTPQSLPRAQEILAELLAELPVELSPGRPEPERRAALASIEADVGRYLRHEASWTAHWTPREIELRFGFEENSLPPLVLDGEGGEVRLRGVIDRVDVEPGGHRAVVRDYKTGRTRREYQGTRWQPEQQIQVALYMLVVRDLLGLEPAAGFYQPLSGPNLRARGIYRDDFSAGGALFGADARDPEQLAEVLEDARAQALELVARLREGGLEPCPRTCSRYGCRYPGICRST